MKNQKPLKLLSTVLFFGLAAYLLYGVINSFISDIRLLSQFQFFSGYILLLLAEGWVPCFIEMLCSFFSGLITVGKMKSKRFTALAIVFIICAGWLLIYALSNGYTGHFFARCLLPPFAFIGAFALSKRVSHEPVFAVQDTVSEAAKVQQQTEKQNSVYEQQLKDGIITQEEYNQLMNRK